MLLRVTVFKVYNKTQVDFFLLYFCMIYEYVYEVSRVALSVQCLATGWMTGRSRFDLRQRRKGFFL
jgi:hypothetical protein